MPPRILLTGLPGCGKTTVVTKVADLLRGRASGFYTEEVRDAKGRRIGFRVISLEGERGELARKGTGSGPRVGSYCVNVKDFERIALPSLKATEGRVLLIDEIGKMESFSVEFVRLVEQAFVSEDASILATVPLHGGSEFINRIRRGKDIETVLVTRDNREALPDQLAAKLFPRATRRPANKNSAVP